MSKTYAVFCSPGVECSAQLSLLKEAFKSFKLAVAFYSIEECPKLAPTIDADVLIAAGGDGTVNTVASQAYKLGKTLGVIPLGTLNHFAKDIGTPLVLLQAIEVIVKGNTKKVDIGTINDRVFLNNSSVGIYPTIVRTRLGLEKRVGKPLAALASVFMVATRRLHLYNMRLMLDGNIINKKSSLLFVGNNTYSLKGLGLPSRDDLWHGTLHLYVLKTKRVDRLAKTAAYSLLGKRPPESYIERFEGKKLTLELASKRHIWIAYDGEIARTRAPVEFHLRSKGLRVITK